MRRLFIPGLLITLLVALVVWAVLSVPEPAAEPGPPPTGLFASPLPSTTAGDESTAALPSGADATATTAAATDEAGAEPPASAPAAAATRDPLDPGMVPHVPGDANPSVAAVVAASQAGSHPERFSAMIAPAPFDPVAYLADPQAYLEIPEPGRVYQVAQPGPGVQRLRRISPVGLVIQQGERVELVVQTGAGMPVTFTSWDLGRFDNLLTTISVQADAQGYARTGFTATPGTYDDADILAGSPVTTGQVRFTIHIELPGLVADAAADGEG